MSEPEDDVVEEMTEETEEVSNAIIEDVIKDLVSRVTKLVDVKSIMTLVLTIAFVVLVNGGKVGSEQFMAVFTMIVGFYFGSQNKK